MSKFTVYIKAPAYIRQWLVFHFGDPVVFPPSSAENATIRRFLAKQPRDMVPPMEHDDEVAVCIPDSCQKPVETYNYLNHHARRALLDTIRDTYRLQLWNELNGLHESGCTIMNGVRAWCQNNGISIDYDCTVKMQYQRMRDEYLANGVDLRKKHKNKNV